MLIIQHIFNFKNVDIFIFLLFLFYSPPAAGGFLSTVNNYMFYPGLTRTCYMFSTTAENIQQVQQNRYVLHFSGEHTASLTFYLNSLAYQNLLYEFQHSPSRSSVWSLQKGIALHFPFLEGPNNESRGRVREFLLNFLQCALRCSGEHITGLTFYLNSLANQTCYMYSARFFCKQ